MTCRRESHNATEAEVLGRFKRTEADKPAAQASGRRQHPRPAQPTSTHREPKS